MRIFGASNLNCHLLYLLNQRHFLRDISILFGALDEEEGSFVGGIGHGGAEKEVALGVVGGRGGVFKRSSLTEGVLAGFRESSATGTLSCWGPHPR